MIEAPQQSFSQLYCTLKNKTGNVFVIIEFLVDMERYTKAEE